MSRIIIGRRIEAGPQGEHVQALIERLDAMTPDEAKALAAARGAAWNAARAAALNAAWDATRGDVWDAVWGAAWGAARAAAWDAAGAAAWVAAGATAGLLVRDLIDTAHYDELTRVVRSVLGPIHPDDPEVTR